MKDPKPNVQGLQALIYKDLAYFVGQQIFQERLPKEVDQINAIALAIEKAKKPNPDRNYPIKHKEKRKRPR